MKKLLVLVSLVVIAVLAGCATKNVVGVNYPKEDEYDIQYVFARDESNFILSVDTHAGFEAIEIFRRLKNIFVENGYECRGPISSNFGVSVILDTVGMKYKIVGVTSAGRYASLDYVDITPVIYYRDVINNYEMGKSKKGGAVDLESGYKKVLEMIKTE